jgi:hypothetical protein
MIPGWWALHVSCAGQVNGRRRLAPLLVEWHCIACMRSRPRNALASQTHSVVDRARFSSLVVSINRCLLLPLHADRQPILFVPQSRRGTVRYGTVAPN